MIMACERKISGNWQLTKFWIVVVAVAVISISKETYADNLGECFLISPLLICIDSFRAVTRFHRRYYSNC